MTEYELIEAIRYVLATYLTDPWTGRTSQWVYSSMPMAGLPELPCVVVDDTVLPKSRTQVNVSQTSRKLKRDYPIRIYFYANAGFDGYIPAGFSSAIAREDLCRYYAEQIANLIESRYSDVVTKVLSLNSSAKVPQGFRPQQISQIFFDDNSSIYYCFYEFMVRI
jgi:hypothetical protein